MIDNRSLFGTDSQGVDRLLALGLDDFDAAPESSSAVSLVRLLGAPDDQIDRYKLIGILGEGGYGIVYLAEQQEPVKRRVALKVIKPGMDSRQVIARFEAERQALALLDHPHIARVYDAGTTQAGRPYFAMEYVKGIPITAYCDKYKLGIRERLRLFVPLCQAIQHAHHKGIIHRDIKPSNALVTLQEERPIPRIIDFGVAKALHQRLTDRTLVTEQGQFIGTPEYMSPEQAELTGLDIDTRTDVYSLGVLLYELLTGRTPFDPQDLRRKGYTEMQRIICGQDPPKPSTKLTMLGSELEEIARQRSVTAEQLRRSVCGDLEWIAMKAMEKDRTRRYATASDLAEDIERHLNNEPVMARPPSALYRLGKLARRNRGVFAGVTAVAAALVIGLAISAVSLVREQHAHEIAVAARKNEAELRQQAEARELAMHQLAYASDMRLAQHALSMNDLGRARQLLEDHRPAPGEVDLRGWEWRYLWQECRSDAIGELRRFPKPAHAVAYSPDGGQLAVAGFPGAGVGFIEVWDVPARKRTATLLAKSGHLVTFAPHGNLLATADVNQIQLWRTGTWDRVGELPLAGGVQALRFSPNGRQLASLSFPDEVTLWAVDQQAVVRRFREVRPLANHMGALDFSPDGKALVTGDGYGRLQVIDLASGNKRFENPEAHPKDIASVAWSPDGTVIASGCGYEGNSIRLWDAASGKPLGELRGHASWICDLVFSQDSRRLYSSSPDQTIRLWNVSEQECLAILRGSTYEVQGLALAPDGATLASACKDGIVAFWSAHPRPKKEQSGLIALDRFARFAFAPNRRVLAVPGAKAVRLFDPAAAEEIEPISMLGADVSALAYSSDGTLLVAGGRGKIRVWSCTERRLLRELNHPDPNGWIYQLGFRSDGKRLLSVDTTGLALWWDTLVWQPVAPGISAAQSGPIALSPDGRFLAIGTTTGAVRWLNAETGELLHAAQGAHRLSVTAIAFSNDGMRAASVANDGRVAIWDPSSFQLVDVFQGHMQAAFGVAFSPDGLRLATSHGGRETVKLWDLSTRRELLVLPGRLAQFWSVAFSPDDQWLAACTAKDRTLHLWHAPSWEEIEIARRELTSRQSP